MQKLHPLLAWLLLFLLVGHLLLGSVTLLSSTFLFQGWFPYLFLVLVCAHAAIALWRVFAKRGRGITRYAGENRKYWLRILSGLALLPLAFVHRTLWTLNTPFGVLLRDFEWPSLLAQLLLLFVLMVHVSLNLRPLLMDTGLESNGRLRQALLLLAEVLFLLAVVGAVAYFMEAGA